MGFLDEIRETLRRPPGPPGEVELPDGLVEAVQRVALGVLQSRAGDATLKADHGAWGRRSLVRRKVDRLWIEVSSGLYGSAAVDVRWSLVLEAVRRWLEAPWSVRFFGTDDRTGLLSDREVERLMAVLRSSSAWRNVPRYLFEVGALDIAGNCRTLLGDRLIQLGPREQVLGLLHAEVLQSTGIEDDYRLPRGVFGGLARRVPLDQGEWPAGLARLVDFGLLVEKQGEYHYVVDRVSWFEDVADDQSPLGILVRSALEDHAQAALGAPGPTSGAAVHELAELVRHELGNVVASLGLTVGQLRRDARADQVQRLDRLEGLTGRLGGFAAKLELLAPGNEPIQVVELMEVLQDALAKTAHERNGHLTLNLDVAETRITARSARIRFLFENLVRNAAQAAQGHSSAVTLRISIREEEEGARVIFEDDGPGVPESVAARLFERGVSGRGSSGMGLAFAREIAAEHRGELRHERPTSGGARFVLTLLGASDA
ncbi:MAG: HAMP domain-containing histidine kinase [Alphaproteobacteria bacterium]|nr:HAMP domain-containing histidine kinase [Alphaproteobacteria bacterium]MCB9695188.1 HAMP domain-containing histidine kinase [Alphaproteobacteria bacterium]